MKNIILILLFACFSYALEIPKNHLVSTSWLEKNLNNEKIVIIDTRKESKYKEAHIENAINFPKKMWFQGKIGNIPKKLNSAKQVQEMFSKAAITEDSILVFYSQGEDNTDFADAASGVWTAYTYGFENSVILDGGLNKWLYEKKEVTNIIPKVQKSDIEIETFNKSNIASLNDIIEAQYNDDIQISDARVSSFYTGKIGRDDLAKKGRIPTAKLTPMIRYTKKINDYYVLLPKQEASKTLNNNDFGLDLNSSAIFYCNTGHKAIGLWFVSKFIVGMEDVKVYGGSMVEYTRTSHPMQTGESFD